MIDETIFFITGSSLIDLNSCELEEGVPKSNHISCYFNLSGTTLLTSISNTEESIDYKNFAKSVYDSNIKNGDTSLSK